MEINPYAAPRADITEPTTAVGRPAWVWVIFVFYLLGTVSTIFTYAMMLSGKVQLPEPQKSYWASLGVMDYLATAVVTGLSLSGAVSLFRLKRAAAWLFPTAFGLSLMLTSWHAMTKGWLAAVGSGFYGALAGWLISLLICVYAWHLKKRGVLR